ncbi:hypothetical protein [Nocardia sp. NPDC003183]
MTQEDRRPAGPVYDFDRVKVGRDLTISHVENRCELGVVSSGAALFGRSLYVSQVREFLAPVDGLRDRERELSDVAKFCRGEQPYMWIRAKPWAGKSALLSWYMLYPPPDVTVIGFFITDRLADQRDHRAFTDAVLDQLAVLLPDQRALIAGTSLNRDGLRNELLTLAAQREAAGGRRVVLVVDGLDEDAGKPPIVSLLPQRPDPNLRVVVASRHGPTLPIPHKHPLKSIEPYPLDPSPFAAGVRDLATAELDALLCGPGKRRELLSLITAANGLTASELTELTDMAPYEIDGSLRAVVGRSFRTRMTANWSRTGGGDPVYVLAHETLQRTAEERLGIRQLDSSLGRLYAWADRYRDLGWPIGTPDFLLRRYFPVLDRHRELERMIAVGLDRSRHDRMRTRTGGDVTALGEIRTVQQRICDQHDPDLLSTARLARHRDYLHDRNRSIPTRLPAVLARLGQHDRAEALAYSYSDLQDQVAALAAIAVVVRGSDPDYSARLTDRAEILVDAITDSFAQSNALTNIAVAVAGSDSDRAETLAYRSPFGQAEALAGIAKVVAAYDLDRAETLAHTIADPYYEIMALADIVCTLGSSDTSRAARLTDRAEGLTTTIFHPMSEARALARIAEVLASSDPLRAARLTDRAETITRALDPATREIELLARIAEVVAAYDPDRAEALAHTITEPFKRSRALARVVVVMAAYDLDRAETLAHTITDPHNRASALAGIAEGLAGSDPDYAARLTDRAEPLFQNVAHPRDQAAALAGIADEMAFCDPGRAARLADRAEAVARTTPWALQDAYPRACIAGMVAAYDPDRAEALAHTIADPFFNSNTLAKIAEVVAAYDLDRAEALAHTITDPYSHSHALAKIAEVVAAYDLDRAEALAHTIIDLDQQAEALVGIAEVTASSDPDRVVRLTDRIESLAHTDQDRRATILARLAAGIACSDPDRAETLARSHPDPDTQAAGVARLAERLAGSDPDRAEALAHTLPDQDQQAHALAIIAAVTAGFESDTDHAARLTDCAQSFALAINDPYKRDLAVARIVAELVCSDPDRAETIARTISEPYVQVRALTDTAWVSAGSHPDRLARLAGRAETIAQSVTNSFERDDAFDRIAAVVAISDPYRAETVANLMNDHERRATVLTRIAAVMRKKEGAEPHDRATANVTALAEPRTVPSELSKSSRTNKHLLAVAWSISRWETPAFALPAVDIGTLNALLSDLLDDPPQAPA